MEPTKDNYYQQALTFHRLLQSEVYQGNDCLTPQMNQYVKEYYPNFLKYPDLIRFYEYNWAERMINIIPFITKQTSKISILDAGCGVGSESIFFSFLNPNARVVGVDHFLPYSQLAQKRLVYWERITEKPLNVSFKRADIMDFVPDESFDIIWTQEAISHIHTPDSFIQKMYQCLKKDGLIFISDSNLLNPYMYCNILKLRGFKKAKLIETKDEETGKTVKVFSENIFTVPGIEKLLKKHNFTILPHKTHGFLPPSLFSCSHNIPKKVEDILSRMPFIGLFGGIYTVVARKSTD